MQPKGFGREVLPAPGGRYNSTQFWFQSELCAQSRLSIVKVRGHALSGEAVYWGICNFVIGLEPTSRSVLFGRMQRRKPEHHYTPARVRGQPHWTHSPWAM